MNFILGTAGHIDHGKSSLVQALSGTNPDRLPEEQARGVTIELGFAHLSLTGPEEQNLEIGIVDVPGHADFVNNMVAGVGAIDLSLIVVAADDGWMPQSEEHLHILSYLGITRAVIALTKIDLAEDPEFASEFVRDELRGTPFAKTPIIPVSSKTGQGLHELRTTIAQLLSQAPAHEDIGVPCLPIDRAFTVKGMGTIVTGTLSKGDLKVGDRIILQPGELPAHVRSIQNHNRAIEHARPGMRTAVNIPDLSLDSRKEQGVKRGLLLTSPPAGKASDTLDVLLTRISRPIPAQPATKNNLKNNQKVRLHYGSGRSNARLRLLHGELEPGQSTIAQLRLESPLLTFAQDRIVIRNCSGEATLAGAVVLDPLASRRLLGKAHHQAALKSLAENPSPETLFAHHLGIHHFVTAIPSPQHFPFSNRQWKAVLKNFTASKRITKITAGHVETTWWNEILQLARKLVTNFHQTNPDLAGLPLQDLRSALGHSFPQHELFPSLIDSLATLGIEQAGEHLRLLSHRTDIPPELAADAESILATLAREALNPPNRKDLAPTPDSQRALAFLIRVGKVLHLDEKTVLHPDALAAAESQIRSLLTQNGRATASEIRQHLNTSRRIAMPLLEYLDSQGVTRREGDYRELTD
ncbi:MAG: selenocysteine-specific translation elongation factor [Verrucomicrobiota bacterium]